MTGTRTVTDNCRPHRHSATAEALPATRADFFPWYVRQVPRPLRLRFLLAITAATAAIGASATFHYERLGLTLSHYDARGHLVVARRIVDSVTPGWQQVGAVWLPLPHLLNALPVQFDLFYRSGASAVAMSIASYAVATAAITWIVLSVTESAAAAAAAAAVFVLNPNVLYLQATPMTEPLLLATTTVAVAMLIAWTHGRGPTQRGVGVAFALACLTRYEAWPVTVAALAAAAWTRSRQGDSIVDSVRQVARIALYPAVAIVGFAVFSRVVIGAWFVSSGFFVPENKALGDSVLAAKEIGWGARALSGPLLTWIGGIGVAVAVVRSARALALPSESLQSDARRPDALIAVSLLAMAAIPWAAFYRGHPFRIRYMVPLMAIEAIGAGILAGIVSARRVRLAGAIALAAIAVYELRPLDRLAPIVLG